MYMIDAVLAFALTMLVLATMASAAVDAVYRWTLRRENGLRLMLEQFFDGELKDWAEGQGTGKPIEDERKGFVDALLENPISVQKATIDKKNAKLEKKASGGAPGTSWKPATKLGAKLLDRRGNRRSLALDEMLRKLPDTELGKRLIEAKAGELEQLTRRLSAKYGEYEAAAVDLFRRGSQIWSVLAGLAVAFVFHVDAFTIANTYLEDEGVRAKVIAASESIQREVAELPADASTEQFDQRIGALEERIGGLTETGVPIGWDEYPDGARLAEGESWVQLLAKGPFWIWLARIVLTGLLIGLGGPFWFDAVRRIGSAARLAGGAAGRGKGDEGKGDKDGGRKPDSPDAGPAPLLATPPITDRPHVGAASAAFTALGASNADANAKARFAKAKQAYGKKEAALIENLRGIWE